jgi:hypothetical protein
MPHRVVRPHEEAVAVLGQRENNDVLRWSPISAASSNFVM